MLGSASMRTRFAPVACLSLLLALCSAGAATASDYERMLARQFQAIAFSAEIGGEHRDGRLVRWTQPIRAQIFEGERYWDEVEPVLEQLRRVTGASIFVPPDFSAVNFEIRIVPRALYRQLADPGVREPCLTEVFSDPATGAITKAHVLIQSDDRYLRQHCVVEELAQAMGLMDDSAVFERSIFNDRSLTTTLTLEDRIMLAVLYDDRLRPNMGVAKAMRIAPVIIRGLRMRAAARARAAAALHAPTGQTPARSATTSSRLQ